MVKGWIWVKLCKIGNILDIYIENKLLTKFG